MKNVSIIALLVFFLTATGAVAQERVTVSAGAGAMSGSMNVAAAKGFFKEQGVNAEVISYKKGKIAFDKFLEGVDDFATCNVVAIVLTDFDVSRYRLIGTLSYSDSETKLLARKSAEISTVEDLRGKKIGTVRATSAHFYLCKFLTLKGISCDDVEIVFMSKKELPDAIASGKVDAICQHGIPIEKAKEKIVGDWVSFQDNSIYRIAIQLVANQSMLDSQPDLVKGLLKGTLRADAFIKSNMEEAIEIVAKDKGYPIELMTKAMRDEAEFDLSLQQSLLLQLEQVEQWAIANKLVKRTTPRDYFSFIDTRPLRDVAPEKVTLIQ